MILRGEYYDTTNNLLQNEAIDMLEILSKYNI